MHLLIFNCWSHSLTFHLFEASGKQLLAEGAVERIAFEEGTISISSPKTGTEKFKTDYVDHGAAIKAVIDLVTDQARGILPAPRTVDVIAHRVVHGGEKFHGSIKLDPTVLESLRELAVLAPLHLPHNLAGIQASLDLLPDVPQIAVFDTAFHQTIPLHAFLYPLPYDWYQNDGIRRYGFHGHAHRYAFGRACHMMGRSCSETNAITVVIGRGISICAIKEGRSIDTTMGMTPLEGVMMDTRCGDIDPGLTTFMMERLNLSPMEVYQILNEKSGLMGIAGSANRQELIQRAGKCDQRAALALTIQGYRLRKKIGGYLAALGKPEAIVFSASEESYDRELHESIGGMDHMGIRLDSRKNRISSPDVESWLSSDDSPIKVLTIPAHPEIEICTEVVSLLD